MTVKVAINEAILLRGTSGSGRATQQITAALRESVGVTVTGVRPCWSRGRSRLRNAVRDARWDLYGSARAARDADVLVSPCNIGMAGPGQRHLLVVYDVMVWESAELFDPFFGAYARRMIPFSVRRADRVLTLSTRAREFLLERVPTADIRVIRLPGRRQVVPHPVWNREPRVVLMVGETATHKNHVAAISAVSLARSATGADLRLRIIGPPGRDEDAVQAALASVDREGQWTTRDMHVNDRTLDEAYAKAWVLVQPSLNEGYGLPLVEAAQHGVPVIHSGAGAMPEVLSGCSVDSVEPVAFASRLQELLSESEWNDASATVLNQADRFSWQSFRNMMWAEVHDIRARAQRP